MRRIGTGLLGTLLGLYLLLSYRTSLGGGTRAAARGVAPAGIVTAAGVPDPASGVSGSRRRRPRAVAPSSTARTSAAPVRRHRPAQAPRTSFPATSTPALSSRSGAGSAQTVVNGTPVSMQYGVVQARIVVSGGRIVSATAISAPDANGRDVSINADAIPILAREVVRADSARIDTVSGATFTSGAYRTSVQAAIDAAHLR